jgi:type I restriction enzyme M protein
MITGEIKNQIDRIWDAFWSGGISNPLDVIEQITYLFFLRRLDDLHTLEENKSARLKRPMERRIFPQGKDAKGRSHEDLRWSRFKHLALAPGPCLAHDAREIGERAPATARDRGTQEL